MDGIIETAMEEGSLNLFLKGVDQAGLTVILEKEGPFTIFAPINEAFASLSSQALDNLWGDNQKLARILRYHIAPGNYHLDDLENLFSLETLEGSELSLEQLDDDVAVDTSVIIRPDIECTNGMIHLIESILIPPEMSLL
ncbi:MAG: fasciclin domain-containing protein [Patescibacteria group bacterium]|nr:fasciclin domain-containing protein [Patescibacteria group bacterium]